MKVWFKTKFKSKDTDLLLFIQKVSFLPFKKDISNSSRILCDSVTHSKIERANKEEHKENVTVS